MFLQFYFIATSLKLTHGSKVFTFFTFYIWLHNSNSHLFPSRRHACTSYPLGTEKTLLNINMLADRTTNLWCRCSLPRCWPPAVQA